MIEFICGEKRGRSPAGFKPVKPTCHAGGSPVRFRLLLTILFKLKHKSHQRMVAFVNTLQSRLFRGIIPIPRVRCKLQYSLLYLRLAPFLILYSFGDALQEFFGRRKKQVINLFPLYTQKKGNAILRINIDRFLDRLIKKN